MLTAQFKTPTKGGSYCFAVKGSPAELANYFASIPEEWLASHTAEDGSPLLFSPIIPPGKKDKWHPLKQVMTGKNAGRFVLDTTDISFAEGQMKAIKNDRLADKMATAIVSELRGTVDTSAFAGVQIAVPVAVTPEPEVPETTTTEPNLGEGDINNVE